MEDNKWNKFSIFLFSIRYTNVFDSYGCSAASCWSSLSFLVKGMNNSWEPGISLLGSSLHLIPNIHWPLHKEWYADIRSRSLNPLVLFKKSQIKQNKSMQKKNTFFHFVLVLFYYFHSLQTLINDRFCEFSNLLWVIKFEWLFSS